MLAVVVSHLVLALIAAPPFQASSSVRLTGTVVDAGTNEPLPGVEIAFLRTVQGPPGSPPLRAVTDGAGRFSIDIPQGDYRFLARRTGYVPSGNNGRPTPIIVTGPVQTMPEIRLERGGTIAGKIVDVRGNPLPRLVVDAVRSGVSAPPGPAMAVGESERTNDLGEFRLSGLPTGKYYVAARPMPQLFGAGRAGSAAFVSTYYPGVAEQAAASVVEVTAGATVTGIDFSIFESPTRAVSGTVVDERNRPVKGAVVTFARVGEVPGIPTSATTQDRGRFSIMLPEGDYVLAASIPVTTSDGGRRTGFRLSGPDTVRLTVGSDPTPDVRLVAQRPR